MSRETKLAEKYTKLAKGFTESSYANPEELMRRRVEVVLSWGKFLQTGDSVLELGCGDGSLAHWLAREGLRYTGTDLALGMIEAAKANAAARRDSTRFFQMDMNSPEDIEDFDCIFGFCRTFFFYCESPQTTLEKLKPHVRQKIILDWNHYSRVSLGDALSLVRESGFKNVTCRPFLVPLKRRLPPLIQNALYLLEKVPVLGLLPTRRKFSVVIKGEVE